MIFENLKIERVIIHEVFTRDDNKNQVKPRYGDKLITLSPDASGALKNRVITAMGKASQSVEMTIHRSGQGSMLALGRELLAADNTDFVTKSTAVADLLASAQLYRNIPGGILVVFTGEVDYPAKKVIAVIKAEPQNGFTRRIQAGGGLDLEFLTDLILTPQAKLYKIGIFVESDPVKAAGAAPADGFRAFIYDVGMTAANKDAAAQYYYDLFLGCSFPQSSARLTKDFHDLTKAFIKGLDLPEETKTDLHTGLYTYLKVNQAQTVQVNEFAQSYLVDDNMRDTYEKFMSIRNFPTAAVPKDLTDVAPHLKQRKVRFRSDVRLTAPADRFDELIQVTAIQGIADDGGEPPQWTQIIVRDRIQSQE